MTPAALPSTPFTYQDALAGGVSRRELRAAWAAGEVYRVRRGVYAPQLAMASELPSWALHRTAHLHALRAALQSFPGTVASHTSAAVVHGLDLVISASSPVELTVVERAPKSRLHDGLTIHHADSTETPHAVAAVDSAVAAELVSVSAIRDELGRQRRWKGRPRALEALELVDPVRESWLESYSFVTLHGQGLPIPVPQVEIYDEHFDFMGRVDGLWPRWRTFAEADGEGKYFLSEEPEASTERTAVQRLAAERVRHRRLESLGLVGVRWSGEEILRSPEAVGDRVRAARWRGEGMPFRGWARRSGRFVRLEAIPQE